MRVAGIEGQGRLVSIPKIWRWIASRSWRSQGSPEMVRVAGIEGQERLILIQAVTRNLEFEKPFFVLLFSSFFFIAQSIHHNNII